MTTIMCTLVFEYPLKSVIDIALTSEDVKPNNIFVNYREGEIRFSDVQLGDL
jgi:hypothetical protein